MEDLLNIAAKTMEKFDPATDKVDDYEKMPDGEYSCLLEDVKARKNDKGTNWISLTFTVLEGDYENRKIFVNFFFTEKTVERSIKGITKMAYDFGYEFEEENAIYMFEHGNYSCDCNRSLFIQREYGEVGI